MPTERWQQVPTTQTNAWPMPPAPTAIGRGLLGRCPGCAKARIFSTFLRVVPVCPSCGAPLGLARADDAPPYFTILLVGHIVVPLLFLMDRSMDPPMWVLWAIFPLLALVLSVALIQPIKGGTVGLMLSLNMLKSDPTAI